MPHSGGIMRQGVHLSDVTHFWEAPLRDDTMPWAVTANLAVRQTPARSVSTIVVQRLSIICVLGHVLCPATLSTPAWIHLRWMSSLNLSYSFSSSQCMLRLVSARNHLCRFGAGFPHSGGGEDVDFCVRLGVPVVSEFLSSVNADLYSYVQFCLPSESYAQAYDSHNEHMIRTSASMGAS